MVEKGQVKWDLAVNSSIMKGESAVRAMERTELINIHYDQGALYN